ncbi:MAG: superoxide dismutase [Cu-Zn] SodC [Kiloniellales bacterium]|jgi:Cu-Zn family superoxide dismutase|nr:superoxide dismutase [Cu-Zn] SodC [Kiloniellales bacterium]
MGRALISGAALCAALLFAGAASAQERVEIEMFKLTKDGMGSRLGTITAFDTDNGFLGLKFDLSADLPPGGHGLHVHENGSCDPAEKDGEMVPGLAAGSHYDPQGTGKHEGPSGSGHLGDLPVLYVNVDEDGARPVTHTLVAPRLTLADIRGLAIVIHAGSDNFRDDPKPLGGGGARIACGLIPG